jgi:hypothetical protein
LNEAIGLETRQRPSAPLAPLFISPTLRSVFDFRAQSCHSVPMETHTFGFKLRANATSSQKAISYQSLSQKRFFSISISRRLTPRPSPASPAQVSKFPSNRWALWHKDDGYCASNLNT